MASIIFGMMAVSGGPATRKWIQSLHPVWKMIDLMMLLVSSCGKKMEPPRNGNGDYDDGNQKIRNVMKKEGGRMGEREERKAEGRG